MEWKKILSSDRLRESTKDSVRGKGGDMRNPIESDFGRVLFCSAVRRLHDKTQVFPLTSDDIIHSRLTHSLEVMNVGYSIALNLAANEVFLSKTGLTQECVVREIGTILKTTGIVHDIGNPPFGHFGEDVVKSYFKDLFTDFESDLQLLKDCGDDTSSIKSQLTFIVRNELINQFHKKEVVIEQLEALLSNTSLRLDYEMFDGNASSFRVLTKLQYLSDLYGLNLTCATLAATLKYPNFGNKNKNLIGCKKHGVFSTESEYLAAIAASCDMKTELGYKRYPLTFLMEAADTICYLAMDVEDAITQKEWFTVEAFIDAVLTQMNVQCPLYDTLNQIKEAELPRRRKIVDLRNAILGYLIQLATKNFIKHLDKIEEGVYQKELLEDDPEAKLDEILSDLTRERILQRKEILSLEITGNSIIRGLFDNYINLLFNTDEGYRNHGKRLISKSIFCTTLHEHLLATGLQDNEINVEKHYEDWDVKNFTIEEKLRIIRDYVTGMTDKFALNHYKKLSGHNL